MNDRVKTGDTEVMFIVAIVSLRWISRHLPISTFNGEIGARQLEARPSYVWQRQSTSSVHSPRSPVAQCHSLVSVGHNFTSHYSVLTSVTTHKRKSYIQILIVHCYLLYIIVFMTWAVRWKKMHPAEIEFMAENEIIQIVPTFNHASHVHLIRGSYGPFRAGLPLNVPLWVALNLRQKKTCRILAPDWMSVDKLNERLEEEKASKCVTLCEQPTKRVI